MRMTTREYRLLSTHFGLWICVGAVFWMATASAEQLERVISQEDPRFRIPQAHLSVGRDGRVYIYEHGGAVTCLPDGSDRRSATLSKAGAPITGMATLPDGTVASAMAHFAKSVTVWESDLHHSRGTDKEYLVNDKVGFISPAGVASGTDGFFYALDQTRDQVARVSRNGRREAVITLSPPPKWSGGTKMQVAVPADRMYFRTETSQLYAYDLRGKFLWKLSGMGPFCAEDDGTIHALASKTKDVKRCDKDGKPLDPVALDAGLQTYATTSLGLTRDSYVVRGQQDRELFRTYDRATGKLKATVLAKVEILQFNLSKRIWAPGEQVSVSYTWQGAQGTAPDLDLWIRPLGLVDFRELAVKNGTVEVPADLSGICQLRLGLGLEGSDAEPRLDTLVEIRRSNAVRGVSIWTIDNRVDFAAGESVPLLARVRAAKPEDVPATLDVSLEPFAGGAAAWKQTLALKQGNGSIEVPGTITALLTPGLWRVTAAGNDSAVAPQWLRIGRSAPIPATAAVVRYGDYGSGIPGADFYTLPEQMDAVVKRLRFTGVNLFVDRFGIRNSIGLGPVGKAISGLADMPWLEKDPLSPATEKCALEDPVRRCVAAFGANGIESRGILLRMDAGLPLGDGGFDGRTPEAMVADLLRISRSLAGYRSFTGWSWAANWWNYTNSNGRLDASCKDDAERNDWLQAKQAADKEGAWSPVLDTVGERWMSLTRDAHDFLSKPLKSEFPKLTSAITGPYRNAGVHPPLSFGDADEIDLQFQCEQIQPPLTGAFNVDYYRRPGRRVWGHPELGNDTGTGGMVLSQILFQAMRAPDGTGSNDGPGMTQGRAFALDPRWSGMGRASVHRAAAELLQAYLPWWKALSGDDPVALMVSRRMVEISTTGGLVGSQYFRRLWAAHTVLLAAGRPATVIFPEELKPNDLKRFRAVVVIGQNVPPEPAFAAALKDAAALKIGVYVDATCRAGLMPGTLPLDIDFDAIKGEAQDDSNWPLVLKQVGEAARALAGSELGKQVPPIFTSEADGLFASQRSIGQGRYVWIVNQSRLPGAPDHWWRCTLNISETGPLTARVILPDTNGVIYDVMAQKRLPANAPLIAEYNELPARIYAVLPEPIRDLKLTTSAHDGCLDWELRFAGPDTLIPIRIRLVTADGAILAEEFRAASIKGVTGSFAAVPAGGHVEAVELLGGEAAAPDQPHATAPLSRIAGARGGDVAVSADGQSILVACRRLGTNCAGLDAATGTVRWQAKVGDFHALSPVAAGSGFAVTGADLGSAEVHHSWRIGADGTALRRVAGFGIPMQATNSAFAANFENRPMRFAIGGQGKWTATSGDLGINCIDDQGRTLWKRENKPGEPATLWAATAQGVVISEQDTLLLLSSTDGHEIWSASPMPDIPLIGAAATADGKVVVGWTKEAGGQLAVLRDGKPVSQWAVPIEILELSPDGMAAAITNGPRLTLLDLTNGPRWGRYSGDAYLRPHFSADGKHIAVGNEKGTMYVIERGGKQVVTMELDSATSAAWLPGGDLVWVTWLGEIGRMSVNGVMAWRHHLALSPAPALAATATDRTPWSNALPQPLALQPNLIDATQWAIRVTHVPPAHDEKGYVNPVAMLADGQTVAPEKPWVDFTTASTVENGWIKLLSLEFDAWRRQVRVDAITIVEDPAHPASWMRSVLLQWWDDSLQKWADGPVLRSDQATHSHRLPTPLTSRCFRLVSPGGVGRWPAASPRFAEVVFHGKDLGPSHRDVAAGRAAAILFDELDGDVPAISPSAPVLGYDAPFSGTRYLRFAKANVRSAPSRGAVGSTLANWDFPIVEKPAPGEYRWLQFAWRATDPATTSVTVSIAGLSITAGKDAAKNAMVVAKSPPREWTTVRIDLWSATNKKSGLRIRTMGAASAGAGFDLDQMVLARDEKDLPPERLPKK